MKVVDHCLLCDTRDDVKIIDYCGLVGFNCPKCGRYKVNPLARQYFFDTGLLNKEHKKMLIEYIRQRQPPEDQSGDEGVVVLTPELIKEVTGVESRSERH
jgi:hypothetical protein